MKTIVSIVRNNVMNQKKRRQAECGKFEHRLISKFLLATLAIIFVFDAFGQELSLGNSKALLYDELAFALDNQMSSGGMTGTISMDDGLQYFCVSLDARVSWKDGQNQFAVQAKQIKLIANNGKEFPMVGSFRNGLFSNQCQGLMIWHRGKQNETIKPYKPVFAVPTGTTSAKLVVGDKAEMKLEAISATAPNTPSFTANIDVIEAGETVFEPSSKYPGFQGKPSFTRHLHAIARKWTTIKVDISPLQANGNNGVNFTIVPPEFGLLQEVNGEKVYTVAAGRKWNKGISNIAEHIPVGKKQTMILFFGISPLSSSAELLYNGLSIAQVHFSKK